VDLTWHDRHHADLSATELHDVLALRNRVFVVEQQCCYQDVDGRDLVGGTRHLCAWRGAELVAYARILAPEGGKERVHIGRVIVDASARGQQLGRQLMDRALASCERRWPGRAVQVAAQAHLEEFYGGLGFVRVSEVYDDDGIPHVDMVRGTG
jgi:ElaA protein